MNTTPDTRPSTPTKPVRRYPLFFHISIWAVPVLVLGQFAMVAVIPVAIALIGSFVSPRLRPLRGYTAILATAYATPLAIWMLRPDGAQSLSKDMHPAFFAVIAVAAAIVLVRIHWPRRR